MQKITQIEAIEVLKKLKKDFYENQTWTNNAYIAGIDEVGRGCSAGPIVACAVILHPKVSHQLLQDSKKLTHQQLVTAYEWIVKNSWYGIGICNNHMVDSINIYQANKRAMKRAYSQLIANTQKRPSIVLVDAVPLSLSIQPETLQTEIFHFTKGESKSSSISAASIIAKVFRDRLMHDLGQTFPNYRLEEHKGYCTGIHEEAIKERGISFIHRKSFIHTENKKDEQKQQSLFC